MAADTQTQIPLGRYARRSRRDGLHLASQEFGFIVSVKIIMHGEDEPYLGSISDDAYMSQITLTWSDITFTASPAI